jgi:hypothetical protein
LFAVQSTGTGKAVVMADHELRFKRVRGHIKDAHDELQALPAEDQAAYETGLARLGEVVAYARMALDAADARLISTNAFTSIQSAACNISNDPRAALHAADGCADALLDAVALLPVTHGGEIEQQVRDAAATLQRSAAERLNALRQDVDSEAQRLQAFRSEIDEWISTLKRQIEDQAAVDRKVAQVEQTIRTQSQALDEHMAQQSKAFTESQQENAAEFQAGMDAFRAELALAQKEAVAEVEERVAEIRRMEKESATLVGAIGLAGTADLHREQGRRQRRAAEILRGLTVLAALGAVAVALVATSETEPTAQSLIAKLFASLLLAGLAAYFARQSARHRAREEHASALQLELAAFNPFIEALTPEQREEERVIMTRKMFGKTGPPEPSEGAAPLSFLLQRRRKAAQDESDGVRGNGSLGSASHPSGTEEALERSEGGAGSNGRALV